MCHNGSLSVIIIRSERQGHFSPEEGRVQAHLLPGSSVNLSQVTCTGVTGEGSKALVTMADFHWGQSLQAPAPTCHLALQSSP